MVLTMIDCILIETCPDILKKLLLFKNLLVSWSLSEIVTKI